MSESGAFSNWVGAIIDPAKELILFAAKDKGPELAERLVRIGYRAAGVNSFTIDDWKDKGGDITIPKFSTVEEMKDSPNKLILDVRGEAEAREAHLEGSLNIPFGKIAENVNIK